MHNMIVLVNGQHESGTYEIVLDESGSSGLTTQEVGHIKLMLHVFCCYRLAGS